MSYRDDLVARGCATGFARLLHRSFQKIAIGRYKAVKSAMRKHVGSYHLHSDEQAYSCAHAGQAGSLNAISKWGAGCKHSGRLHLDNLVRGLVGHQAARDLCSSLGWDNGLDAHPFKSPIDAHHIQRGSQPPDQCMPTLKDTVLPSISLHMLVWQRDWKPVSMLEAYETVQIDR